jgi:hypothetical protein
MDRRTIGLMSVVESLKRARAERTLVSRRLQSSGN